MGQQEARIHKIVVPFSVEIVDIGTLKFHSQLVLLSTLAREFELCRVHVDAQHPAFCSHQARHFQTHMTTTTAKI